MGAYMLRRRNISLSDYNDESYPLNAAARALNYSYAADRRVVNPKRAHLLVASAGERQHARVYEELAERYFEGGEDIGTLDVLLRASSALGLETDELTVRRAMERAEGPLLRLHRTLDKIVDGVPHFVIRESTYGSGLELAGPVDIDGLVEAVSRVQAARTGSAKGHYETAHHGFGLQQPAGMVLPGYGGRPTRVPTADRLGGASISAVNLHGWAGPSAWPYEPDDFSRDDESDDARRYEQPNFGDHLDAPALRALTETYAAFFSSAPSYSSPERLHSNNNDTNKNNGHQKAESKARPLELLDLASSSHSHYPTLPNATRVAVHGMNAAELAANPAATLQRVVADLNERPALPFADGGFDFVTMAASVGYLTRPREVFAEMHRVLKPGGAAPLPARSSLLLSPHCSSSTDFSPLTALSLPSSLSALLSLLSPRRALLSGVAIVSFSNRVHEEKATRLWLRHMDEDVALCSVVRNYFYFGVSMDSTRGGWVNVTSADVSPHPTQGDPLWVVAAVKA